MTKYESKKNPGTFLTTDDVVDPKTKTVFVTMDGKEKSISVATLKRWWTKVEDDAESEAPAEEAPAPAEETPAEEVPAPAEETPAEEAPAPAEENPAEEAPAPVKEKEKNSVAPKMKKKAAKKTSALALSEETSSALTGLYGKLNDAYFNGLLPDAAITVRATKRIYDCCSVRKFVSDYEILMCAGTLNESIADVAAAMLHAMVHIYCAEAEIVETCQKGRYHNAKFKAECESRDLAVEYDRANGHVHTRATEALKEALHAAGLDSEAQFVTVNNGMERD